VHVAKWYELHGIVDTRDTCAVSRYFVLLRYTAVYRDLGDTGIVTLVSTISIEVSRVSHNTNTGYPCLLTSVYSTRGFPSLTVYRVSLSTYLCLLDSRISIAHCIPGIPVYLPLSTRLEDFHRSLYTGYPCLLTSIYATQGVENDVAASCQI